MLLGSQCQRVRENIYSAEVSVRFQIQVAIKTHNFISPCVFLIVALTIDTKEHCHNIAAK